MVMAGHQIVGMAMPVEALARCMQDIEELPAVILGRLDITPGIAVRNDMIKRPGKLKAQRSGHDSTSLDRQEHNKGNKTLAARHRSVRGDIPCKQSGQHYVRI
jgi:hypothetical protein